jgi:NAD(P)-dependent dehydrogenase (short-subunit alcohol dehydrogenase family)
MRYRGKTVLVTGAGGAIGGAIARRFHSEGATVIAVDIALDRLTQLSESVPGIRTVAADVATPEGADAAVGDAGERIDILSNNVGMSDGGATLDEIGDAEWSRVIGVNLTSALLVSRRVIGSMLRNGGGVILNMSSVAGLRGGRTGIAYTSSKWALVGMTQNIASSLGPEGVRAYVLCPAIVIGAVTLGSVAPTIRALKNRGRDSRQPSPSTPDDVANVAAFLASDDARHMNGIAVPIDNWWLAF